MPTPPACSAIFAPSPPPSQRTRANLFDHHFHHDDRILFLRRGLWPCPDGQRRTGKRPAWPPPATGRQGCRATPPPPPGNAISAAGATTTPTETPSSLLPPISSLATGTRPRGPSTVVTGSAQDTANAIKVTCSRTAAGGNAVNLSFASILGHPTLDITVSHIAMVTRGLSQTSVVAKHQQSISLG